MKILVVSDTHGNLMNLREAMRIEAPFDMLMHLGDICHDEEAVLKVLKLGYLVRTKDNTKFQY